MGLRQTQTTIYAGESPDTTPLAAPGTGGIRFDAATQQWVVSANGGAWTALATGGPSVWQQTGTGAAGSAQPADAALGELQLLAERVELNDLTGGTPYFETDAPNQAMVVRAPGKLRLASSGTYNSQRLVPGGGTLNPNTNWPAFNRVTVTSAGVASLIPVPDPADASTEGFFTRIENSPASLGTINVFGNAGVFLTSLAAGEACWLVSNGLPGSPEGGFGWFAFA